MRRHFPHTTCSPIVTRMPSLVVIGALFGVGIFAAVSRYGNTAMEFLMLHDPLVMQLGGYLYENGHVLLADVHERLLTIFGLPHHAFLLGCVLCLCFGERRSINGVAFWIGYATALTVISIWTYSDLFEALAYAPMWWCFVPSYMLGVMLPKRLASVTKLRFSMAGLLVSVTLCAVAIVFFQHSINWALRVLAFVVLSAAVFRGSKLANHAMNQGRGVTILDY